MNRAEEIMEEMYEEHSDQEAIRELLRKKNTGTLPVQIRKKSRKYMDIWCGKDFVTKISVK